MNSQSNSDPAQHGNPPRSCRGFTVTELLVVIVIIAVLSTLAFAVFGRVAKAGSAATMTNNMRQIGSLIALYAQDHNGTLPGPLHLGQRAIYRRSPPTHLAYHLQDYLDGGQKFDEGEQIEMLSSPMWRKQSPTLRGISLLSQQDVDPDPRVTRSPWGYAGATQGDPNRQPITLSKLAGFRRVPWALIEADREHPAVGSAGWRTEMPEKPVHGSYRLALKFDGSVVKRRLNEELEDER